MLLDFQAQIYSSLLTDLIHFENNSKLKNASCNQVSTRVIIEALFKLMPTPKHGLYAHNITVLPTWRKGELSILAHCVRSGR